MVSPIVQPKTDTTDLTITEYIQECIQQEPWSSDSEPDVAQHDRVGDPTIEELAPGPTVRFRVTTYDFDTLVLRLVEFEREHGVSSIEMFSRYLKGDIELDEERLKWVDLFILYLGTPEVGDFACP
jgi:hypothetical protein